MILKITLILSILIALQKIQSYYGKYMPWLKFHNSDIVLLSLGSKLSCYQTNQHGVKDGPCIWNIEVPKVKRNDIRTNDISRFIFKHNLIVCGNRYLEPFFLHKLGTCMK